MTAVQITARCTANASLTSATVPMDTMATTARTTKTKCAAESVNEMMTVGTATFGMFV